MKKLLLIIMLLITGIAAQSQARYEFSYDNNGNRTQRIYFSLKNVTQDTTVTDSTIANITDSANIITGNNYQNVQQQEYQALLGEQRIIVYPNPTKGELQVDIYNYDTGSNSYILVTDMQGRIINKDENVSATNKINLTNVAKGEYVLKIYLNNLYKEWIIVKD